MITSKTLNAKIAMESIWMDAYLDQTSHKLIRSGSLVCFIKEFRDWHRHNHNSVPSDTGGISKDEFISRLKTFREVTKPGNETSKSWKSTIGFIGGKFKYARITFTSTMARLNPVLKKEPLYELLETSVNKLKSTLPEGLKSLFQREWILWLGMDDYTAPIGHVYDGRDGNLFPCCVCCVDGCYQ